MNLIISSSYNVRNHFAQRPYVYIWTATCYNPSLRMSVCLYVCMCLCYFVHLFLGLLFVFMCLHVCLVLAYLLS